MLLVQHFDAQEHWRPPSGSFRRDQDFQAPPQIPQQPSCHALLLVNRTEDQWNWNLLLTSQGDVEDVQVEVSFGDFVPAFVVILASLSSQFIHNRFYLKNDLSHSSTVDNRKFIIRDSSKKLKGGQRLQVGLSAKPLLPFGILRIVEVKFNGRRICPDESSIPLPSFENSDKSLSFSSADGCARLDKKDGETAGRWDGVLGVFSKIPKNYLRVDLIFDQKAWALGVSDF